MTNFQTSMIRWELFLLHSTSPLWPPLRLTPPSTLLKKTQTTQSTPPKPPDHQQATYQAHHKHQTHKYWAKRSKLLSLGNRQHHRIGEFRVSTILSKNSNSSEYPGSPCTLTYHLHPMQSLFGEFQMFGDRWNKDMLYVFSVQSQPVNPKEKNHLLIFSGRGWEHHGRFWVHPTISDL